MQDSSLHRAARNFAAAGIPVFPVEVNGKKPVTAHGLYDATTDLEKIDAWWNEADYNLAIPPASVGLCVVDFDHADDVPNYPPTYTVKTPRGRHLYYEGSLPTSAGKLGEHIDTRGDGGYVLVPPSVVNGKHYEVINECDYTPLPDWIAETFRRTDVSFKAAVETPDLPYNIARVRDMLAKCVDRGDVAIEGRGGDDFTYRICCAVLDLGVSTDTARDLLEEIWNPHCSPPWTTEELNLKLYNASQYQQNEAGAYALRPIEESFPALELPPEAQPKRSRFYFKDEIEQDAEPDPQWLVKDLISERSTVLFVGPSQNYKSFLALDIVLGIATGKPTFGSIPLSGPVFYAALEGKAHLKKARRSWRFARDHQGKIENFYIGTAPLIGVDGEVQEFCDEIYKRCINGTRPRLIVLDTLAKCMSGLNENDAKDAGRFIRFCDGLVETFGCAVLVIHHTGKDETRGARGSSAFHAGFDTVLEIKAHRPTKAVSVRVVKHKDAEERDVPWMFEGKLIQQSLAFNEIDATAYRVLIGDSSELAPKKIGKALQRLGAYGEERAVLTTVLARELTPSPENESVEDHEHAVNRTSRALASASTKSLEAYAVRSGKHLAWMLPAPSGQASD